MECVNFKNNQVLYWKIEHLSIFCQSIIAYSFKYCTAVDDNILLNKDGNINEINNN